jgi:hypothetical protein
LLEVATVTAAGAKTLPEGIPVLFTLPEGMQVFILPEGIQVLETSPVGKTLTLFIGGTL